MPQVRYPLVGPAYQVRSIDQSCQRTVNWYAEITEAGGTTPMALYPTPGLLGRQTIGNGPVREMLVFGSPQRMYVVSGAGVYRVDTEWNATLLGTLETDQGSIGMACNGIELLIVDGVRGYLVNIESGVLQTIDDVDFPSGVTWCAYLDGYFIVGGDGSQAFYISALLDGGEWNGTDFASAEGDPDPLIAGIVDHRELWLFGGSTVEVWFNTGNATFPIERTGNTFVEHGIAAPDTVSKIDNTVFWLGSDTRGDGIVWRAEGYRPVRISTHGLEHALNGYARIDDAIAYTYQQEGHSFYVLTFPTADATWVYDVATQQWHERAWWRASDGTFHRHRSNCSAFFNREHVVGDWETGRVYAMNLDTYTDDGGTIKRVRTTYVQDAALKNVMFSMLEVDIEHGVGDPLWPLDKEPLLMMRQSRDRGHTWGNYRTRSMGRAGEYNRRCRFERCGTARGMVFEISVTDPVKAVILGGVVIAEANAS